VVAEVQRGGVVDSSHQPLVLLLMAIGQGLTLVHFLAQLKRFLWNRGCIEGLF